jgi:hypothetical protein
MKYTAEIGSGATIYMPSFINMCSGIQKLMGGGGYREREREIILLLVFPNKEIGDGSVTALTEFFELYLSIYTAYS